MEISYVYVIILSVLEHCLCCRSSSSGKTKETSSDRYRPILKVTVASKSLIANNCNELSAKNMDVNNKQGNMTFSTPQITKEYMPYSLKLHMDRIDNGSYVYCTSRYKNKDVAVSKYIHFLLNNGSTLPGFGNFIPEYYNKRDANKSFGCQEGYTIIRNSTSGSVKVYSDNSFKTTMNKLDNGTLAVCGYFKNITCDSPSYKCEVERIIERKYIYLYKNDVVNEIMNKNPSIVLFIITGAGVAIIIISLIITIAFRLWKNKPRSDTQNKNSTCVTTESLTYAELQLTAESNQNQQRNQDDSTTYATIVGVLASK